MGRELARIRNDRCDYANNYSDNGGIVLSESTLEEIDRIVTSLQPEGVSKKVDWAKEGF